MNSTQTILNAAQPIPGEGEDAFLFASIAVIIGCICEFSALSPVLILLVGASSEFAASSLNLGRFSNSFSIWLEASPPELLLYGFLPPLLFESAVCLDFHIFKRLAFYAASYAIFIVVFTTAIVAPAMLYILNLSSIGWTWQHAALFVSLIASTDALAVSSVLKRCGGPENLLVLMESESLLNDASSLVLFTVFLEAVQNLSHQTSSSSATVMDLLPGMLSKAGYLSLGGAAIGLCLGWLILRLLRALRSSGHYGVTQDLGILIAISYFSFYVANVNGFSGVIAVVVLGLYGAATSKFELAHTAEANVDAIQGTIAGGLNSIVFFLAGASSVDFLMNTLPILHLHGTWVDVLAIPFIYIVMMLSRGVIIVGVNSVLQYFGFTSEISMQSVPFLILGGLRGALSLVMAMVVAADDVADENQGTREELIKAQMLAWTSCFVLITLCFNAPVSPSVLQWCGLLNVPEPKLKLRKKARNALVRRWQETLEELRNDDDELLTGVDWDAVKSYTNPTNPHANINLLRGASVSKSRLGAAISRRSTTLTGSSEMTQPLLTAVTVVSSSSEEISLQQEELKSSSTTSKNNSGHDSDDDATNELETPFLRGEKRNSSHENGFFAHTSSGESVIANSLDIWSETTTMAGGSPRNDMPTSPMDALRMTESDLHQFENRDSHREEEAYVSRDAGRDLLVEARIRLIAGLKRYAFRKRAEGLLSPSGARMLGSAFDEAMLHADRNLCMWTDIQSSAANRFALKILVSIYYNSRRIAYDMPASIHRPVVSIINFVTHWIAILLSKAMLKTCEVAVTYYMACTSSNQVLWLQQAMPSSSLHSELAAEIHMVSNFIKNRELEAPSLFQGVQMYRAAMALLQRQINFIEEMYKAGVVDEHEHASMKHPIRRKIKALEAAGPIARINSTWTVLRQISFLKSLPDDVLQRMIGNGSVRIFNDGEVVWSSLNMGGHSNSSASLLQPNKNVLAIVIRGLVYKKQNTENTGSASAAPEQYIGSGSILGLVPAVTRFRTSAAAELASSSLLARTSNTETTASWEVIASSSTLQKGVSVFYLSEEELDYAREEASHGNQSFKEMILQMHREAAIDVLDEHRTDVLQKLCQEWLVEHRHGVDRDGENNLQQQQDDGNINNTTSGVEATSTSDDDSSAKSWMLARQHAQRVLFNLRRELRLGAKIVEIDPYIRYHQRSHCILLAGQAQVELQYPSKEESAPQKKSFSFSLSRSAFEQRQQKEIQRSMPAPTLISGPAVLLMPSTQSLSSRVQGDDTLGSDEQQQRGSSNTTTTPSAIPILTLLAGRQGALLVVCPVLKQQQQHSVVHVDSIEFDGDDDDVIFDS